MTANAVFGVGGAELADDFGPYVIFTLMWPSRIDT